MQMSTLDQCYGINVSTAFEIATIYGLTLVETDFEWQLMVVGCLSSAAVHGLQHINRKSWAASFSIRLYNLRGLISQFQEPAFLLI